VKPENIYLKRNGQPLLLDFGAARQAVGERSRSMQAVLSPGYAPIEQYSGLGNQGPWTDVYACAATLYRVITGETPPDAPDRGDVRLLPPSRGVTDLPQHLNEAIMAGLAMDWRHRPQSVKAFQDMLEGDTAGGSVLRSPEGRRPAEPVKEKKARDWYFDVWKKYAVFEGRARRKEYWMFAGFNWLSGLVLALFEGAAGLATEQSVGPLTMLYILAVVIPSLAVTVRRLHDTNRSGWWLLGLSPLLVLVFVSSTKDEESAMVALGAVVIAMILAAIILLAFMVQDSQPGDNRYGPSPKAAEPRL
jgi:uncharacterized membrane protein YhaH (DUF805 family)